MKILTTISALFIIGGSAGWLIELIFRRMVHGKWINPGFLCGPCLPLYGTGVLVLYGFCNIDLSFIPQIWSYHRAYRCSHSDRVYHRYSFR